MIDLKINITANDDCSVIIQDLQQGYLPENSGFNANSFKFSDTKSIVVLIYRKSKGDEIQSTIFKDHSDNNSILIPVTSDGWFVINYIVLPTKSWVDLNPTYLDIPEWSNGVYYIDTDNILYKYLSGNTSIITIDDIISNGYGNNITGTTISRICNPYFSICALNKCYLNIAQEILNSKIFKSCNDNQNNSELLYKRDLIWMSLNVIKYMVTGIIHGYYGCTEITASDSALAEAQRIIEKISGCNGLCKNMNFENSLSGCGCI